MTNLAAGTDGKVLTATNGAIAWHTPGASGSDLLPLNNIFTGTNHFASNLLVSVQAKTTNDIAIFKSDLGSVSINTNGYLIGNGAEAKFKITANAADYPDQIVMDGATGGISMSGTLA